MQIPLPLGTSPVVQWLRLCAPNAGGPELISGRGSRSHMPQRKIPHAAAKTRHSQMNIKNKKRLQLAIWLSG